MPLRGLTIIVAGTDPDRLRSALGMAATQAALGATITLCQSGLALAGIDAASIDQRFHIGGMTGVLAGLGEARLVAV